MKKLKHGDRIDITEVYRSCKSSSSKKWYKSKYEHKNCIFLGYRTVYNGDLDYDEECGTIFIQTDSIRVMLVSINSVLNPIYTPLMENDNE